MTEINLIKKFYKNKKVMVLGHTGFKGSWLAYWLHLMGANVIGVSNSIITTKGVHSLCNLKDKIKEENIDILDYSGMQQAILKHKPDMIFHLAAQPLVRESYNIPLNTFATNVQGTANVLESIKHSTSVRAAVFITTDKVYLNQEWAWGYRENDELGGKDPYSASKACAELVIKSYHESFFKGKGVNIASARAGNVIGGGDWATDRIVVDIIKSIENKEVLRIRSPNSTRPFQHVLEPLYGYLLLAKELYNQTLQYSNYNFGPDMSHVITVKELVEKMKLMSGLNWKDVSDPNETKKESKLLALDSTKAKQDLGWEGKLSINQTLAWTATWYQNYKKSNPEKLTKQQVDEYESLL